MNNLIKVLNQDGQLVVSSRQIAEDFEKRNSHVVEAIENKIKSLTAENSEVEISKLFIPTTFKHNGNEYKEYLLTRDGFTFIVMGFTGAKADSWKLKYIEAFNKMEQALREQQKPQCIEDVLIQSLQEMKDLRQQISQANTKALEADKKAEQTKEDLQAMRDVITLNSNSWRKDTSNLINKMALAAGGYDHIKAIREESYKLLEERMGVQLSIRLTNKRRRMADEGVCKSKRDKLTLLDVIVEDKKLIEGYVAIVKEMAIKYKVA